MTCLTRWSNMARLTSHPAIRGWLGKSSRHAWANNSLNLSRVFILTTRVTISAIAWRIFGVFIIFTATVWFTEDISQLGPRYDIAQSSWILIHIFILGLAAVADWQPLAFLESAHLLSRLRKIPHDTSLGWRLSLFVATHDICWVNSSLFVRSKLCLEDRGIFTSHAFGQSRLR